MTVIVRIAVGLVAVLFLYIGAGIWFTFDATVAGLGLTNEIPALGRAAIRADFGALFFGVGGMSAMAAWRMSRTYAFGALILVSIAITGRIVSILFEGPAPGGTPPMLIEALSIGILASARHVWKSPAA